MHTHPAPPAAKPVWKWSGGKQRLLPQLLPLLPPGQRLIEPFVGAGSVFLAATYGSCVLSDANSDLIAAWVALKERPREFIARASRYFCAEFHSKQSYLHVRSEFNELEDRFERAVRFPYLNRFSFNGLFRVNRQGEFNVPYGAPAKLPPFDVQRYEAVAAKLSQCLFLNSGYAGAIEEAGEGDILYCDPPYLDSTSGDCFTSYTVGGFSRADHEHLVQCCLLAANRGAKVLVSNHDTPEVRALFDGWRISEVSARRSVSAKQSSRGVAREIVAMLWQ